MGIWPYNTAEVMAMVTFYESDDFYGDYDPLSAKKKCILLFR